MNPRDLLQALCVILIWGFNFVAIKTAVTDIPPLTLSALRFAITAVILIPFFKLNFQQIKQVFYVGLVLGVGHFGMLMVGLRGADAATAALLIQLGVPFSSILAAIFFADKLGWRRALAMAVAFGGAGLLLGEPQGGSLMSMSILVFSAFCWAWANILIKKIKDIPPLAIIGWMGLMATPFIAALSYFLESGQVEAVLSSSLRPWLMLSYTIIASSVVAYHLWYNLLARLDVNQIVPFTLLLPVVGVSAGVLILGEELTVFKVMGGLLTMSGVAIIQLRQAKKNTEPQD